MRPLSRRDIRADRAQGLGGRLRGQDGDRCNHKKLVSSCNRDVGGREGQGNRKMEKILDEVEKLCFDKALFPIINKVADGGRLSFEDGLTVMNTADLNTVGMLADYIKRKRVGDKVYFVVNRHVNPTNICAISCKFCAFGKPKGAAGTYEMTFDEILAGLNEELREVHVVGGVHPDWNFEHYLDVVRVIKNAYPDTHVKAYTAVEIDWFSEISGQSLQRCTL